MPTHVVDLQLGGTDCIKYTKPPVTSQHNLLSSPFRSISIPSPFSSASISAADAQVTSSSCCRAVQRYLQTSFKLVLLSNVGTHIHSHSLLALMAPVPTLLICQRTILLSPPYPAEKFPITLYSRMAKERRLLTHSCDHKPVFITFLFQAKPRMSNSGAAGEPA